VERIVKATAVNPNLGGIMKSIAKLALLVTLAGGAAIASAQNAPSNPPPPKAPQSNPQSSNAPSMPRTDAVMKDIEQTFGFMPQFVRQIPEAMLPAFWRA